MNIDAGNLSKELFRLEKMGIFTSLMRGNRKYYNINKSYPLYRELRAIVFKTIGIEGGLKLILDDLDGISCAFLTSKLNVILAGFQRTLCFS